MPDAQSFAQWRIPAKIEVSSPKHATQMMQTLKVELGARSYPIYIGTAMNDRFPEILALFDFCQPCVVLSDSTVAKHYGAIVGEWAQRGGIEAHLIEFPAGEKSKSLRTYEEIIAKFAALGVARDWTVIAMGGGVTGDLAGFVAATYMRGLRYIQMPTTLLAQVDSSVGGKVGINHPAAKNLLGAFYQPTLVWIDTAFLQTLPERELICGLAEMVKYGVIREATFFTYCESHLEQLLRRHDEALTMAIYRSCAIKADIVARDERDQGVREILNFGHTIGHALEASTGFRAMNHGEAVLWGMRIEAWIARHLGLFDNKEFARFESFISRIPLKATLEGIDHSKILEKIRLDKKVRRGKTQFILPESIGRTTTIEDVPHELIQESLAFALESGWS